MFHTFANIAVSIATFISAAFGGYGGVATKHDLSLMRQESQKASETTPTPAPTFLGADNFTPAGGKNYFLYGNGVGTTDTSVTLTSLTVAGGTTTITMSNLGTIGCGTFEPGNVTRQEFMSFTGISQNSDGTATLTGVSRGLAPIAPYAASALYSHSHSGGTKFILSNSPACFQEAYPAKNNDETITGYWTIPEPLALSNPATMNYVLTHGSGGTVSINQVVIAGTAGETVSAGQVLYLRQSDARWYKASVSIPEASSTILAIAQGSGTSGAAITGGVLTNGLDSNQSGLTGGINYFLGTTAGTISTATSTRYIGRARNTTTLYFDTYSVDTFHPTLPGTNVFTGTNTFNGITTHNASSTFTNIATSTATATTTVGFPPVNILDISKQSQIFTSSGTFVPKGGVNIYHVRVYGCGGTGGNGNSAGNAGGGGAGGKVEGWFNLTGTTSVGIVINSTVSMFGSIASSTCGANAANGTSGGGNGGLGGVAFATTSAFTISAINSGGMPGSPGSMATNGSFTGNGGSCDFGSGGRGLIGTSSGDPETSGNRAQGYCAGGAGADATDSGGLGRGGLIVIDF